VDDQGNNLPDIDGTQPQATQWVLARQAVLLGDDGSSTGFFLGEGVSTGTIWDRAVRNSRVDLAAWQLNDIRNQVTQFNSVPWLPDQRNILLSAAFFPRAERQPPSMYRQDHALTVPALAGACSEFAIEWTWDDDTYWTNGSTNDYVVVPTDRPKPWFSMFDADRGSDLLRTWLGAMGNSQLPADNIEFFDGTLDGGRRKIYTAAFGYDKYLTPWPSALRITMRLHDVARGESPRLREGRVFQFVVDLPKRNP
jgi:hypothetical protein